MSRTNGKCLKMDNVNNGVTSSSSLTVTGTGNGSNVIVLDGNRQPVSNNCLFHFYVSNFFKIPKDIKNDIIYCQRALKAHIKIHQMACDVFLQNPNTDPTHRKRILDEMESEIYEINAEQQFLILRVRRIIDEFYKSLKERHIPIDHNFTNNIVAREIVPCINDKRLVIMPVNVHFRNTEEKLIEKYFEVQEQVGTTLDIIEVDDESDETVTKNDALKNIASGESLLLNGRNNNNNKNNNSGTGISSECISQPNTTNTVTKFRKSLLKPINQRASVDGSTVLNTVNVTPPAAAGINDLQPKITGAFSLNSLYNEKDSQAKDSQEMIVDSDNVETVSSSNSHNNNELVKSDEVPSVKMSRLNLRQALKRAQAAVRGPSVSTTTLAICSSVPPPLAPIQSPIQKQQQQRQQKQQEEESEQQPKQEQHQQKQKQQELVQTIKVTNTETKTVATTNPSALLRKPAIIKPKSGRSAATTSTNGSGGGGTGPTATVKTPDTQTSSSGESSPERELEETRTQAIEYGQEMFLRLFNLFTPQVCAQLQQRRSKRRRRCVQKNERSMYHYGKFENNATTSNSDPEQKKKRKAFLLSPETTKQTPNKRAKRASADKSNATDVSSDVGPSRSNSNSPMEKNTCNECLQSDGDLQQCVECELWYHVTCHPDTTNDNALTNDAKKSEKKDGNCPACKKRHVEELKEASLKNKNLQKSIEDLKLKLTNERDRRDILQRTSKSYKMQINNLYKFVNTIKTNANDNNQGFKKMMLSFWNEDIFIFCFALFLTVLLL